MVEIQNKELINTLSEKIKESNLNILPRTVGNVIQPVIEIGDNVDQFLSFTADQNTTGVVDIATTSSDKAFYIQSVQIGYSKNAACDVPSGALNITIFGETGTQSICSVPVLTLTAENSVSTIVFNRPILTLRGAIIRMTGTFSLGAMSRFARVNGFTVDTLKKSRNS